MMSSQFDGNDGGHTYGKEDEASKKQRLEEMEKNQLTLDEMFNILDKHKKNEISLNETFKSLYECFNSKDTCWISNTDEMTKRDALKRFEEGLNKSNELIQRPNISPAEVLENTSALKGVFFSGRIDDLSKRRSEMLKANTCISFKHPTISSTDQIEEFESEQQRDQFHKFFELGGYNAAAGGKIATAPVGIFSNYANESKNINESERTKQNAGTYHCKLLCSTVPAALWEPRIQDVSFSNDALDHLHKIRHLLSLNDKEATKECEKFFTSFGSHIYLQGIHFGGTVKIETIYNSDRMTDFGAAQQIVHSHHLNAVRTNMDAFGFCKENVEISEHMESDSTEPLKEYQQPMSRYIHTSVSKLGGPQEASNIPLWKMGLLANNATWVIVDGGKLDMKQYKGVWDIVREQSHLFKNGSVLAEHLFTTWQTKSTPGIRDDTFTRSNFIEAKSNLEKDIDSLWHDFQSQCDTKTYITGIKSLCRKVQTVEHNLGSKLWTEQLQTNMKVSDILNKIINVKFLPDEIPDIRDCVKTLLDKEEVMNFPNKEEIKIWLNADSNSTKDKWPEIELCKSVEELIINTENFLKSIHLTTASAKHESIPKEQIKIRFTQAVEQLLNLLTDRNEFCKYVFLLAHLICLAYDLENNVFKADIDEKTLQEFIADMRHKEQEHRLHSLNVNSKCQQARVLRLLFSNLESSTKVNLRDKAIEMFAFIKKCFKDKQSTIDMSILDLTFDSCTNDIQPFIHALVLIEQGTSKSNIKEALDWNYFENKSSELFVVPNETPLGDQNALASVPKVIESLGLAKYCPAKLTLKEALDLGKDSFKLPNKLQDLPWAIIRKIISVDFGFRENLLANFFDQFKVVSQPHSTKGRGNLDRFRKRKVEGKSQNKMFAECSNPLDVFLAVFICCDAFLKRILVQKLFACQVAIPLFYKELHTNKIIMSMWPIRDIVITSKSGREESVATQQLPVVSFIRVGSTVSQSKSKLINQILRDQNQEHNTFFHRDCCHGMHKRCVSDGMIEATWFLPSHKTETKEQTPCPDKELDKKEQSQNQNNGQYIQTHLPSDGDAIKEHMQYPEKSNDYQRTIIQQPLTILNLRGDALVHEKQLLVLQRSSTILVILIKYDDIKGYENFKNNQYMNVLTQIHKSDAYVILLLTDTGSDEEEISNFLEAYSEYTKLTWEKTAIEITYDFDNEREMNAFEIKQQLTRTISEALQAISTAVQLEQLSYNLPDSVYSDEECKPCVDGKKAAESIVREVLKIEAYETRKNILLPLQGNDLWHMWAKQQKLLKRGGNTGSYGDKGEDIIRKMNDLRKDQVLRLNFAPEVMATFTDILISYKEDDDRMQYFLCWLKHMLDNESRTVLPKLRTKLHDAFRAYDLNRTKHNKDSVDKAEVVLVESSLGLEHFFREISQVYEAFIYIHENINIIIKPKTYLLLEKIPKLAAKVLFLGQPLEIMDGDAANVPLKWLSAVFMELKTYLGDQKLISISVLGVQSSGKSTLLNTMFGLQFAVSAGRCTRGMFIQLVKVNYEAAGFDYAMIIDAEGLRAPEMSGQKAHHDNELATLVIGLSDVAIINIKGETIADMENVLQIVVHELIRLKQAVDSLDLRQSAILVHQNVSAQDADKQLMQGNQKTVQNLDKMTKESADQEHMNQINSFKDVIYFNPMRHVKYISDLWHGSPPMAPVSPEYSQRCISVVKCIFEDISETHKKYLSIENIYIHLKDLWIGILAEDFVFSFRNALEIKAYNQLEEKFQELGWQIEKKKLEWFDGNVKHKLSCCKDEHMLEETAEGLYRDFVNELDKETSRAKEVLQEFIQTAELSNEMENWRDTKPKCISDLSEKLKLDMDKKIRKSTAHFKGELIQNDGLLLKEKSLIDEASNLANTLKSRGKKPSEKESLSQFEALWRKWFSKVVSDAPADSKWTLPDIIVDTLTNTFSAHKPLVIKGLEENPITNVPNIHQLKGSFDKEIHVEDISVKGKWNKIKNIIGLEDYIQQTLFIVNEILICIDDYFRSLMKKDTDFDSTQCRKVLNYVTKDFSKHNKDPNSEFRLKPTLEVTLALHCSRYALGKFESLKSNYDSKHSLRAQLESYKPKAQRMFIDMVESKTSEITAARTLCEDLQVLIREKIENSMSVDVMDKIISDFGHHKRRLIKTILIDLANTGIYIDYYHYIQNPDTFVVGWLEKYTNREVFEAKTETKKTYYMNVTLSKLSSLIKRMTTAVTAVTIKDTEFKTIEDWVVLFQKQISDVKFVWKGNSFAHVSAHPVMDFENFQTCVIERLCEVQKELSDYFENQSSQTVHWLDNTPYEEAKKALWGCNAVCPLCHEPCQKTMKDHEKLQKDCHQCIQHKPVGIKGVYNETDGKLATENCSYLVTSAQELHCSNSWCGCEIPKCDIYHPLKEYKKYMPTWEIDKDVDMSSCNYWKWFMKTYREELAQSYGHKEPEIPDSWTWLTKEMAIKSLDEIYRS